ncbi:MAG: hypothetical protein ACI379_16255 [Nocardioides sp.]|uniref:hypothetical protein n=1 Tax=Nocardioides sp. TaxID=35761 RepID=UPI003F0B5EA6
MEGPGGAATDERDLELTLIGSCLLMLIPVLMLTFGGFFAAWADSVGWRIGHDETLEVVRVEPVDANTRRDNGAYRIHLAGGHQYKVGRIAWRNSDRSIGSQVPVRVIPVGDVIPLDRTGQKCRQGWVLVVLLALTLSPTVWWVRQLRRRRSAD